MKKNYIKPTVKARVISSPVVMQATSPGAGQGTEGQESGEPPAAKGSTVGFLDYGE